MNKVADLSEKKKKTFSETTKNKATDGTVLVAGSKYSLDIQNPPNTL